MKLKITIKYLDFEKDFLVNSKLEIKEALDIISQSQILLLDNNISYIYSLQNNEMVPVSYTFENAKIYNGDKLIIRSLNNGK